MPNRDKQQLITINLIAAVMLLTILVLPRFTTAALISTNTYLVSSGKCKNSTSTSYESSGDWKYKVTKKYTSTYSDFSRNPRCTVKYYFTRDRVGRSKAYNDRVAAEKKAAAKRAAAAQKAKWAAIEKAEKKKAAAAKAAKERAAAAEKAKWAAIEAAEKKKKAEAAAVAKKLAAQRAAKMAAEEKKAADEAKRIKTAQAAKAAAQKKVDEALAARSLGREKAEREKLEAQRIKDGKTAAELKKAKEKSDAALKAAKEKLKKNPNSTAAKNALKKATANQSTVTKNLKKATEEAAALKKIREEDKAFYTKRAKEVKAEDDAHKKALYEQDQRDTQARRNNYNAREVARIQTEREAYDLINGKGAYDKYQKEVEAEDNRKLSREREQQELIAKKALERKCAEVIEKSNGRVKSCDDYKKRQAAADKAEAEKAAKDEKDAFEAVYGKGSYEKKKKDTEEYIKKGSAYDKYHLENDGRIVLVDNSFINASRQAQQGPAKPKGFFAQSWDLQVNVFKAATNALNDPVGFGSSLLSNTTEQVRLVANSAPVVVPLKLVYAANTTYNTFYNAARKNVLTAVGMGGYAKTLKPVGGSEGKADPVSLAKIFKDSYEKPGNKIIYDRTMTVLDIAGGYTRTAFMVTAQNLADGISYATNSNYRNVLKASESQKAIISDYDRRIAKGETFTENDLIRYSQAKKALSFAEEERAGRTWKSSWTDAGVGADPMKFADKYLGASQNKNTMAKGTSYVVVTGAFMLIDVSNLVGGGATKAVKIANTLDDAGDLLRVVDMVNDASKVINTVSDAGSAASRAGYVANLAKVASSKSKIVFRTTAARPGSKYIGWVPGYTPTKSVDLLVTADHADDVAEAIKAGKTTYDEIVQHIAKKRNVTVRTVKKQIDKSTKTALQDAAAGGLKNNMDEAQKRLALATVSKGADVKTAKTAYTSARRSQLEAEMLSKAWYDPTKVVTKIKQLANNAGITPVGARRAVASTPEQIKTAAPALRKAIGDSIDEASRSLDRTLRLQRSVTSVQEKAMLADRAASTRASLGQLQDLGSSLDKASDTERVTIARRFIETKQQQVVDLTSQATRVTNQTALSQIDEEITLARAAVSTGTDNAVHLANAATKNVESAATATRRATTSAARQKIQDAEDLIAKTQKDLDKAGALRAAKADDLAKAEQALADVKNTMPSSGRTASQSAALNKAQSARDAAARAHGDALNAEKKLIADLQGAEEALKVAKAGVSPFAGVTEFVAVGAETVRGFGRNIESTLTSVRKFGSNVATTVTDRTKKVATWIGDRLGGTKKPGPKQGIGVNGEVRNTAEFDSYVENANMLGSFNPNSIWGKATADAPNGTFAKMHLIGPGSDQVKGGAYISSIAGSVREGITAAETPLLRAKYDELLERLVKAEKLKGSKLTEEDVIREISDFSREVMPTGEAASKQAAAYSLSKKLPNELNVAVPIDDFIELKAGVCRHHSVFSGYLLQNLKDDGILKGVAILESGSSPAAGSHVWVRYTSTTGNVIILDPVQKVSANLSKITQRLDENGLVTAYRKFMGQRTKADVWDYRTEAELISGKVGSSKAAVFADLGKVKGAASTADKAADTAATAPLTKRISGWVNPKQTPAELEALSKSKAEIAERLVGLEKKRDLAAASKDPDLVGDIEKEIRDLKQTRADLLDEAYKSTTNVVVQALDTVTLKNYFRNKNALLSPNGEKLVDSVDNLKGALAQMKADGRIVVTNDKELLHGFNAYNDYDKGVIYIQKSLPGMSNDYLLVHEISHALGGTEFQSYKASVAYFKSLPFGEKLKSPLSFMGVALNNSGAMDVLTSVGYTFNNIVFNKEARWFIPKFLTAKKEPYWFLPKAWMAKADDGKSFVSLVSKGGDNAKQTAKILDDAQKAAIAEDQARTTAKLIEEAQKSAAAEDAARTAKAAKEAEAARVAREAQAAKEAEDAARVAATRKVTPEMTYYEMLGVTEKATPEELKAAHRVAVKAFHPDAGGDEEIMKLINNAMDNLSDTTKRAKYDDTLAAKRIATEKAAAEQERIAREAAEAAEKAVAEAKKNEIFVKQVTTKQEARTFISEIDLRLQALRDEQARYMDDFGLIQGNNYARVQEIKLELRKLGARRIELKRVAGIGSSPRLAALDSTFSAAFGGLGETITAVANRAGDLLGSIAKEKKLLGEKFVTDNVHLLTDKARFSLVQKGKLRVAVAEESSDVAGYVGKIKGMSFEAGGKKYVVSYVDDAAAEQDAFRLMELYKGRAAGLGGDGRKLDAEVRRILGYNDKALDDIKAGKAGLFEEADLQRVGSRGVKQAEKEVTKVANDRVYGSVKTTLERKVQEGKAKIDQLRRDFEAAKDRVNAAKYDRPVRRNVDVGDAYKVDSGYVNRTTGEKIFYDKRDIVVQTATGETRFTLREGGGFFYKDGPNYGMLKNGKSGRTAYPVKIHVNIDGQDDLARIQEYLLPSLIDDGGEFGDIDYIFKTIDPAGAFAKGSRMPKHVVFPASKGQGAKGFTLYAATEEDAAKLAARLDDFLVSKGLSSKIPSTGGNVDTLIGSSGRVSLVRERWVRADTVWDEFPQAGKIDTDVQAAIHAKYGKTQWDALTPDEIEHYAASVGLEPYTLYEDDGVMYLAVHKRAADTDFEDGTFYVSESAGSDAFGHATGRQAMYSLYKGVGMDPAADLIARANNLLTYAPATDNDIVRIANEIAAELKKYDKNVALLTKVNQGQSTDVFSFARKLYASFLKSEDSGFVTTDFLTGGLFDFVKTRKSTAEAKQIAKAGKEVLEKKLGMLNDFGNTDGLKYLKETVSNRELDDMARAAGFVDGDDAIKVLTDVIEAKKSGRAIATLPSEKDGFVRIVFGHADGDVVEGYKVNGLKGGKGQASAGMDGIKGFDPKGNPLDGLRDKDKVMVLDIPEAELGKYFRVGKDGTPDFTVRLGETIPGEYLTVVDNNYKALLISFKSADSRTRDLLYSRAVSRIEAGIEEIVKTESKVPNASIVKSWLATTRAGLGDNFSLDLKLDRNLFTKLIIGRAAFKAAYYAFIPAAIASPYQPSSIINDARSIKGTTTIQPGIAGSTLSGAAAGALVGGPSVTPTCTIRAEEGTLTKGKTTVLHFSSTGATKGSINNGVGDVGASGEAKVTPSATTQYIYSVSSDTGKERCATTVKVENAATGTSDPGNGSGGTGTVTPTVPTDPGNSDVPKDRIEPEEPKKPVIPELPVDPPIVREFVPGPGLIDSIPVIPEDLVPENPDELLYSDRKCSELFSTVTVSGGGSYFEICHATAVVEDTASATEYPELKVVVQVDGKRVEGAEVQIGLFSGNEAGVNYEKEVKLSDKNGEVGFPIMGLEAGNYSFWVKINDQYVNAVGTVTFEKASASATVYDSLLFKIMKLFIPLGTFKLI